MEEKTYVSGIFFKEVEYILHLFAYTGGMRLHLTYISERN